MGNFFVMHGDVKEPLRMPVTNPDCDHWYSVPGYGRLGKISERRLNE